MIEREVLQIVFDEELLRQAFGDDDPTDFNNTRWRESGVDSQTLQSCFDKGFITWQGNKLVLTDLGRRVFGDTHERHH